MDNDHALHRALRAERATVKLYKARLRELMEPSAYHKFLEFCRVTVHAGCADSTPTENDQPAKVETSA